MSEGGWLKSRLTRWVDRRLGDDGNARMQALTTRENEFGFDAFGFNKEDAKVAALFARFLYRDYFRVECHGIEKVPPGRVLLISNHSGQLPFDGVVIGGAMLFEATRPRMVRAMVEKFIPNLPFASYLFNRWGQITGTPENCQRLLESDEAILVFPEGAKGISKPYSKRYQLQDFGLGFMRLALKTGTPIVPIAVVGAEEQFISFGNFASAAKLFSMPNFPLIPQFLVPGGQMPLPVKYRLYVGEPLLFDGDPDDDDSVIEEKVWMVKATIQSMINRGLKERKGLFW